MFLHLNHLSHICNDIHMYKRKLKTMDDEGCLLEKQQTKKSALKKYNKIWNFFLKFFGICLKSDLILNWIIISSKLKLLTMFYSFSLSAFSDKKNPIPCLKDLDFRLWATFGKFTYYTSLKSSVFSRSIERGLFHQYKFYLMKNPKNLKKSQIKSF